MPRKLPSIQPDTTWLIQDIASLGRIVRNQRAKLALRIDDAAALCGVSSDLLSRLENGKPITTNKLLLILQGMGLHLMTLPAQHAVRLAPALQSLTKELGQTQ
jgi:transcriptional regulator with XRE-family HTH domain